MRVLVVSHACVTAVNQTVFAEVERQTGWDLSLVAPATWQSDYGMRLHLQRGAGFEGALYPVPVWKSGDIPLHIYRSTLAGLLRRAEPDAIYVHHEPYAAATAQVYLANRFTVRRPIGFFTWQNIPKRYPPPFRQLERMVYRQSAFALTGSEDAADVLRAKGYEGPSFVIPAGIDGRQSGIAVGSRDVRVRAGAAEGEALIGFVGRVAEEKGLATMLKALKRIEGRAWRFVVVGTGPYEAELRAQVGALGLGDRVAFLGYVSHAEAHRYLAALDFLVLPSETRPNWKEQFGRVIIEAMASGTPVVGSDSGEIPNLIGRTGGGIVFSEGDAEACAGATAALIDDPAYRRRLAEAGRSYVLSTYTHEALARDFAQVVEQAVQSSTPKPVHAI